MAKKRDPRGRPPVDPASKKVTYTLSVPRAVVDALRADVALRTRANLAAVQALARVATR